MVLTPLTDASVEFDLVKAIVQSAVDFHDLNPYEARLDVVQRELIPVLAIVRIPALTRALRQILLEMNKSDIKCWNTLGCLDQYTCRWLRLWKSRDRETV